MKTVSINKESWHYKLVMLFGDPDEPQDMCAYTRKFALKTLLVCVLFIVIVVLSYVIVSPFVWIAASIALGELAPINGVELYGLVVYFFAGVAYYAALRDRRNLPFFPDSLRSDVAAAAWESFRDKVCFRVEYKENHEAEEAQAG